jgi:hypothetical protein
MVVLMDISRIWVVICVSLPSSHPMIHVMEMACVSQTMVKPLTIAPQIVVVEITFVNINLERHLIIAHKIVEYVEMANVMHLKVALPVSKTVEHV